jgi:hypothetical protein
MCHAENRQGKQGEVLRTPASFHACCSSFRETEFVTASVDPKRTAAVVFGVPVVSTLMVKAQFAQSWKAS